VWYMYKHFECLCGNWIFPFAVLKWPLQPRQLDKTILFCKIPTADNLVIPFCATVSSSLAIHQEHAVNNKLRCNINVGLNLIFCVTFQVSYETVSVKMKIKWQTFHVGIMRQVRCHCHYKFHPIVSKMFIKASSQN